MLVLFLYGLIAWIVAFTTISSIPDDTCRGTVWETMIVSRITAWLLSFVIAAIFFRGTYNKQKKQHEAYAAKFLEAGLSFGPVEGKPMFRAVAVCRNQYYEIDKGPDKLKQFQKYWDLFREEKRPASPPTYEEMCEFEKWIMDMTKMKVGAGYDSPA